MSIHFYSTQTHETHGHEDFAEKRSPRKEARDVPGDRTAISEPSVALTLSAIASTRLEVAPCFDWPFLTCVTEPRMRGSSLIRVAYRLACSMFVRSPRAVQTDGEKIGRDVASSIGRVRKVAAILGVEDEVGRVVSGGVAKWSASSRFWWFDGLAEVFRPPCPRQERGWLSVEYFLCPQQLPIPRQLDYSLHPNQKDLAAVAARSPDRRQVVSTANRDDQN